MGKTRRISSSKKKNGGLVKMLQRSLILGKKSWSEMEEIAVPKGHFAVMAVADDDEVKRFVVPLRFLTHPSFLRLLEQAAEEYGFDHDGALTVPCRPNELERILADQWAAQGAAAPHHPWTSHTKTMVKSC